MSDMRLPEAINIINGLEKEYRALATVSEAVKAIQTAHASVDKAVGEKTRLDREVAALEERKVALQLEISEAEKRHRARVQDQSRKMEEQRASMAADLEAVKARQQQEITELNKDMKLTRENWAKEKAKAEGELKKLTALLEKTRSELANLRGALASA